MTKWNHFPLELPRPDDIRQFKGNERADLERTIAWQVSDLLSRYGTVDEIEVDMTDGSLFDEPHTYLGIDTPPILLEDDGNLVIGQIPETVRGYITDCGAHMLTRSDEDDTPIMSLTVWDPLARHNKHVRDERNKAVRRPVLQELYEALTVITLNPDFMGLEENDAPLTPINYPARLADPEFEELIAQLGLNP